jgi:Asp/Glu/hydantoin racemase
MRLLLLNPNTSQSVTDRIAQAARAVAGPDTHLVPVTAGKGVPYIATRAEATLAGAQVLDMMAELHGQVDAVVIAAFGDPGLGGSRELFPLPIVGLAEAGMLTACMLGRSFAIVSFAEALAPWFEECVASHGLQSRCAGLHFLDGDFGSISGVQEEKEDLLLRLADRAIVESRADVIVLAGAPLAGLARRVRDRVPVPVVDCVEAAVKQAETLVALNPRKAEAGSYRRPSAKSSIGLSNTLAEWLGHIGEGK